MKKILWIEDDYNRMEGLLRPLEKMGFIVDYAIDCPSFFEKRAEDYDLFIVDLILPQKREGEYVDEKEYVPLPGMKLIDEIDKLNKPIVVITVVTDPEIHSILENKNNVKYVIPKGNIFPSDLKNDILKIFGYENAQ